MKDNYTTPQNELYFVHNGISFLREEFGGFNYKEARYLLPRIIQFCKESYSEGKTMEKNIGNNGSTTRVKIRGIEVARAK